jgi:hypothetical protein
VGNGASINFWLDAWCGEPLIQSLNLQSAHVSQFPMKLCNYIQNFHWYIPAEVSQMLPNLRNVVSKVPIPRQAKEDILVWNHTPSGILTLKDAYEFKRQHFPKVQ